MIHNACVIYPVTKEGDDRYLQYIDKSDDDVKLVMIPGAEFLAFLELNELIFRELGIMFSSSESEEVEGDDLTKLVDFLEPYKGKMPVLWEAILEAHNKFNAIIFAL